MNLGSFIRSVRISKNITMAEIAEDICTTKHIYFIEKDKRFPSVRIIEMLGKKLDIDFFEYLPYLECINPIKVKEFLHKFNELRKINDLNGLEIITDDAEKYEDFTQVPWIFEVEYNRAQIQLFRDKDCEGAYETICSVLKSKNVSIEFTEEDLKYASSNLVQFYNLLAVYWNYVENNKKAISDLKTLHNALFSKRGLVEYQRTYVSVITNLMQVYYVQNKFDESINLGKELLDFQLLTGIINRLSVNYAILAACYYKKGDKKKAKQYYHHSIYLCISLNHKDHLKAIIDMMHAFDFEDDEILKVNLEEEFNDMFNNNGSE